MGRVFLVYETLLTEVPLFRYLRQTLSSSGDDLLVLEQNLHRAQGKWGQTPEILVRKRADKIIAGRFCVAVVKAVILFGSETWVLTPYLDKSL